MPVSFGRRRMRKPIVIVLVLGVVALVATAPRGAERIDPKGGCRSNAAVVGSCFEVQGRAFASNGTPGLRIRRHGTNRVLGIMPAENEIAPRCLKTEVTFERDVIGAFTVCPLSREKAGSMQMVCVEEVRDPVVRSTAKNIPERKLADCRL